MTDWLSLFAEYRVVVIRHDEVVQGVLHPGLTPSHPDVRAALAGWGGTHFLHQTARGTEVTLVHPLGPRPRERWGRILLLGLLTVLTTTLAGAYLVGREPLVQVLHWLGPLPIPRPVGVSPAEVVPGLVFSVPLLGILLGHELGHYLTARRYGMDVSPPYFIPAPPWINFVGTFGAFIRLRSAMVNRVMLLDVGAAGPLVSFALSLPAVALGALWSRPLERLAVEPPTPYLIVLQGQPIWLGDSVLFAALMGLFGADAPVTALHPLAFAGWLGLFVTAMNLFPLAQLDGGHILFALLGERQRWIGWGFLALLVALGSVWVGWWIWAALILLLGRGSIGHPPVFDAAFPVTGRRRAVGWICIAIFLLSFVPIPLRF